MVKYHFNTHFAQFIYIIRLAIKSEMSVLQNSCFPLVMNYNISYNFLISITNAAERLESEELYIERMSQYWIYSNEFLDKSRKCEEILELKMKTTKESRFSGDVSQLQSHRPTI